MSVPVQLSSFLLLWTTFDYCVSKKNNFYMHCSERQNFVFGVHFIIISVAVDAFLVVCFFCVLCVWCYLIP